MVEQGGHLVLDLVDKSSAYTVADNTSRNGSFQTPAAPPSESSAKDNPRVRETKRDLPGDFHKYYGQRSALYRDKERRLAKLDIDGDMNYDGKIDNWDPADNGAFQQTPPGLVVGAGEMSKLILRLTPYRVDFRGEAVVTLEVAGINRAEKSGEFNSLDEELSATGKVKI